MSVLVTEYNCFSAFFHKLPRVDRGSFANAHFLLMGLFDKLLCIDSEKYHVNINILFGADMNMVYFFFKEELMEMYLSVISHIVIETIIKVLS